MGIVDDDPAKHGSTGGEAAIQPPSAINSLGPDAVVITSFRHAAEIRAKIVPALRAAVRVFEV